MKKIIYLFMLVFSSNLVYSECPKDNSRVSINSAKDLINLSNIVNQGICDNKNVTYILTNDINLESTPFSPIGSNRAFIGHFDGQGHIIKNISINQISNAGLFGTVGANTEIKNLQLQGIKVIGEHNIGGLVGIATENLHVENVIVVGDISCNSGCGGIVGSARTLNANNTNFTGYIHAIGIKPSNIGGIAGFVPTFLKINQSFTSGAIDSQESSCRNIGGIAGDASDILQIINSYSNENLILSGGMSNSIGGLVGLNLGASGSITIESSYYSGDLQVKSSPHSEPFVGAFMYYQPNACNNSYWNNKSIPSLICPNGGRTPDEMKQQQTYLAWDFNNIWNINENINNGYPYLEPYIHINSAKDLIGWAENVNSKLIPATGKIILESDIDLESISFTPIGTNIVFYGDFNGQGHVIRNLTIKQNENAGLFGNIGESSIIENLQLLNVNITGNKNIGSVVGQISGNVKINNISANGNITCNSKCGGIVGMANNGLNLNYINFAGTINGTGNGTMNLGGLVGFIIGDLSINKSYSFGSLTVPSNSSGYIGGLAGNIMSSTQITNSFSTESLSIGNGVSSNPIYIGGLVGVTGETLNIQNSYSDGSINIPNDGSGYIGGLAGASMYSTQVTNSFSTENLTIGNGANYVAGMVAYSASFVVLESSYFSGNLVIGDDAFYEDSLINNHFGNPCINSYWNTKNIKSAFCPQGGKTSEEMKQQQTFLGWDFNNIWNINENINHGYPYLRVTP